MSIGVGNLNFVSVPFHILSPHMYFVLTNRPLHVLQELLVRLVPLVRLVRVVTLVRERLVLRLVP
jgi:hypothetical protein